jgi:hypothetical protein
MIGNELKNEKNPFFKLVDNRTVEYFLNPELIKNKYLCFKVENDYSTWRCGENIWQTHS